MKAHVMPEDLQPDDTARKMAERLGLDLLAEFEHFRDFHVSKGSVFVNWQSAIRTWLRNSVKFSATRPTGPAGADSEARSRLKAGAPPEAAEAFTPREMIMDASWRVIYPWIREHGDPDADEKIRARFNKELGRAFREGTVDKWDRWKTLCAEEGVEPKPKQASVEPKPKHVRRSA